MHISIAERSMTLGGRAARGLTLRRCPANGGGRSPLPFGLPNPGAWRLLSPGLHPNREVPDDRHGHINRDRPVGNLARCSRVIRAVADVMRDLGCVAMGARS
jgi:hypothetical protein